MGGGNFADAILKRTQKLVCDWCMKYCCHCKEKKHHTSYECDWKREREIFNSCYVIKSILLTGFYGYFLSYEFSSQHCYCCAKSMPQSATDDHSKGILKRERERR